MQKSLNDHMIHKRCDQPMFNVTNKNILLAHKIGNEVTNQRSESLNDKKNTHSYNNNNSKKKYI